MRKGIPQPRGDLGVRAELRVVIIIEGYDLAAASHPGSRQPASRADICRRKLLRGENAMWVSRPGAITQVLPHGTDCG